MAGRVRKGPCAHRACKKPDGNENTQWTFIPDSFHGDGLDQILATIAEDDLKQKLQAFEQAQLATRDEAIAAAMERKEAAAADD